LPCFCPFSGCFYPFLALFGGVENAVKQFWRVLYVVGKQHRGKLMPSIKTKIEEEHGRKLTNRQMSFAKFFVDGVYSNAECARKAGYAEDVAAKQASILLVKILGSRSLFLFRGSEALPLARGGVSEAQGSRFEGLAPCFSALRLASLEHYSAALRLARDAGLAGPANDNLAPRTLLKE
jgi:hypothetical protein